MRRGMHWIIVALAATALAGCAAILPPYVPPTSGHSGGAAAGAPATGKTGSTGGAGAPASADGRTANPPVETGTTPNGSNHNVHAASHVPADSLPSSAALAVLGTIPEPVPAAERVAPASIPAASAGAAAAASDSMVHAGAPARADSSAAPRDSSAARVDSVRTDVPVPSPTQPLGDRPGALERMMQPDSTAPESAAHAAKSAPPQVALPEAATAPPAGTEKIAAGDTCYRVQVAAPSQSVRAERLRQAAASQLLVPMVIEKERGLFKVRTRDCLNREAATQLKRRAAQAGFPGAFLFNGGKR